MEINGRGTQPAFIIIIHPLSWDEVWELEAMKAIFQVSDQLIFCPNRQTRIQLQPFVGLWHFWKTSWAGTSTIIYNDQSIIWYQKIPKISTQVLYIGIWSLLNSLKCRARNTQVHNVWARSSEVHDCPIKMLVCVTWQAMKMVTMEADSSFLYFFIYFFKLSLLMTWRHVDICSSSLKKM